MSNRTQILKDADKRFLWHPFTPMLDWIEGDPLVIERGEGAYLYDTDGRRYFDGVSSLWANVHGHRHPRVDAAIMEQLGKIAHTTMLGLSNEPAIRLAEKLIGIAPKGLTRVFYSDSGSTAVEIAVKMAFQYQAQRKDAKPSKTRFVNFVNAYHGDTIGSVSVGGMDLFHAIYKPLLFDTIKVDSPYCYRCPLGKELRSCGMACLDELEKALSENSDRIAGVIVEPIVQGAAGMIVAPPGHLKLIRELCDRFDVLMICDEVATGFGRTGKMFACEHEGVTPDIMTVAKGLTAGYLPLSATLANDKVFEAFLTRYEDKKTFYHGHTYTGNALACAAAIASIEVFEEERTLAKLEATQTRLSQGLDEIAKSPFVGEVRRRGIMVGIELVKDKASKESFPFEAKIGVKISMKARDYDVIIRPLGDVLVLMPPLCSNSDDIDLLLDAVRKSMDDVLAP